MATLRSEQLGLLERTYQERENLRQQIADLQMEQDQQKLDKAESEFNKFKSLLEQFAKRKQEGADRIG